MRIPKRPSWTPATWVRERPRPRLPPRGQNVGTGRANPLSPSLPLPELANPCAKDSLEDLKPTNPFLFTDITCSPDALSPGSSDVSGQWFHREPRAGLGPVPG